MAALVVGRGRPHGKHGVGVVIGLEVKFGKGVGLLKQSTKK